jgi:hypothetical protein
MTTPSGRKVTAVKRRRIEKERGSTCLQSRRKKHLIKSRAGKSQTNTNKIWYPCLQIHLKTSPKNPKFQNPSSIAIGVKNEL